MQTLYYVLFDDKKVPEPYIFLYKQTRKLDPEQLKIYDSMVKSFNTNKTVHLNDKIFVVFDENEKKIIDIFLNENIPVILRNEYVYTTDVKKNVFI